MLESSKDVLDGGTASGFESAAVLVRSTAWPTVACRACKVGGVSTAGVLVSGSSAGVEPGSSKGSVENTSGIGVEGAVRDLGLPVGG